MWARAEVIILLALAGSIFYGAFLQTVGTVNALSWTRPQYAVGILSDPYLWGYVLLPLWSIIVILRIPKYVRAEVFIRLGSTSRVLSILTLRTLPWAISLWAAALTAAVATSLRFPFRRPPGAVVPDDAFLYQGQVTGAIEDSVRQYSLALFMSLILTSAALCLMVLIVASVYIWFRRSYLILIVSVAAAYLAFLVSFRDGDRWPDILNPSRLLLINRAVGADGGILTQLTAVLSYYFVISLVLALPSLGQRVPKYLRARRIYASMLILAAVSISVFIYAHRTQSSALEYVAFGSSPFGTRLDLYLVYSIFFLAPVYLQAGSLAERRTTTFGYELVRSRSVRHWGTTFYLNSVLTGALLLFAFLTLVASFDLLSGQGSNYAQPMFWWQLLVNGLLQLAILCGLLMIVQWRLARAEYWILCIAAFVALGYPGLLPYWVPVAKSGLAIAIDGGWEAVIRMSVILSMFLFVVLCGMFFQLKKLPELEESA